MIIFSAQQKVGDQNSDDGCSKQHQSVAKENESKHVVEFVKTDRAVIVIQLDKDDTTKMSLKGRSPTKADVENQSKSLDWAGIQQEI